MHEFLVLIDDNLMYLYLPLLAASLVYFGRINSFIVSITLLCVLGFFSREVRGPLWDWVLTLQGNHQFIAWFGAWFVIDNLFMPVLFYIHWKLKLPVGRAADMLVKSILFKCTMHTIIYTNMIWLKYTAIQQFYQFGIPAINIGMGLMLIYFLLLEVKHARANLSHRNA